MKFLFAIFVALGLAAGAYAAAEGLNVSGGALQQGMDATLSCDPDGVEVNFRTTDDNFLDIEAAITEIHEDCEGAALSIRVYGDEAIPPVDLLGICGPILVDDTEVVCNFGSDPLIFSAQSVVVTIIGNGETNGNTPSVIQP